MVQLTKEGQKHVPADIALCIARDVAYALVEVHSKQIIHRDIKSENILFDLETGSDGRPIVKLSDFDISVPLHCYAHTCCIAHFGIHPPDVCIGTPRWMAPEVVQAMHKKNPYGLVRPFFFHHVLCYLPANIWSLILLAILAYFATFLFVVCVSFQNV